MLFFFLVVWDNLHVLNLLTANSMHYFFLGTENIGSTFLILIVQRDIIGIRLTYKGSVCLSVVG